jgi:hypothetical protein
MDRSESEPEYDPTEAYVEALEMYLEAYKVINDENFSGCYKVGMKAIFFSKAYFSFSDTDNKELVKASKKIALTALNDAFVYFEKNKPTETHIIKTIKIVIDCMK